MAKKWKSIIKETKRMVGKAPVVAVQLKDGTWITNEDYLKRKNLHSK